ncbi:hypothetical protein EV175_002037 [Coemansia sp. RSA 1933]|nr:hypothetical protein EV175_002037 [Coemansia sp. RSA 1933]
MLFPAPSFAIGGYRKIIIGLIALLIMTSVYLLGSDVIDFERMGPPRWGPPPPPPPSHHWPVQGRTPSLKVIMPINNNTDTQFYRNTWLGDNLFTVCDYPGPECSMSCDRWSSWGTLDDKTRCFIRRVKRKMKDTQFFIKLDDDALVDKGYVLELMEKYKYINEPVYISDFILNLDPLNPSMNGSYYGNGKFYMFNRKLVDCIDTEIVYQEHRNEDAMFGAMVFNGCGNKVVKIQEDDTLIWHKKYQNKNKKIDLEALRNH